METHKRYLSIDILKGLCAILLVIGHQIIWLFVDLDGGEPRYEEAWFLNNDLFSFGQHMFILLLPVLAGLTFFIYVKDRNLSWPGLILRCFVLSSLGFCMNFLTWGINNIFDWDVLQFVSLSMLISFPLIKKLKDRHGLVILSVLAAVCVLLSESFPLSAFQDSYLYIIFIGDIRGLNYWPFCPWFSIFALGIFIGRMYLLNKWQVFDILAVAGIVLLVVSIVSGNLFPVQDISNLWGTSFFKPSPLVVLGNIGFSLVIVSLTHLYTIRHEAAARKLLYKTALIYYSYGIMWIYLIITVFMYQMTTMIVSTYDVSLDDTLILLPLLIVLGLFLAYLIGKVVYIRKTSDKLTTESGK